MCTITREDLKGAGSEGEAFGIQSLCMKLAYRMSQFYPELMDELIRTVKGMEMEYYKPAVKSVRNRILSGKLKI